MHYVVEFLDLGMRQGGGGYTLLDAGGRTHRGKCAAGERCTSFRAELCALIKFLDDLIAGTDDSGDLIAFPPGKCKIRISLDSQSAIRALSKGPSVQHGELEIRAWERIIRVQRVRGASIVMQYVPGHVDIERQEASDVVAKAAAADCAASRTRMPSRTTAKLSAWSLA